MLFATIAIISFPKCLGAALPGTSINVDFIDAIQNGFSNGNALDFFKIDFGKLVEVVNQIQLPEWVADVFPNLFTKTTEGKIII